MTIIAIDPGASGGIAIAYADGTIEARHMPDDMEQRDLIHQIQTMPGKHVCYMEHVGGFVRGNPAPGSAMFNFGDGYGYLRGVLAGLRIKTILVQPQKWQKGIPGLGGPDRTKHKNALKEHAARLFPAFKVTLKTADALCILDYAQRAERGETTPEAAALPVAIPANFKADSRAAVKWAKAEGYEVPKKNSKEFLAMVSYWRNSVAA